MPVLIRGTYVHGSERRMLQALVSDGSDTVGVLRQAFAAQLPPDAAGRRLQIAYKGASLDDDTAQLAEADLLPSPGRPIPHVFLCYAGTAVPAPEQAAPAVPLEAQLRRRHAAGGQAAEGRTAVERPQAPQERAVPEELDANRCCRLCFDSEETIETGRLFSPCLCSGSMRYIHVACLNGWRMRSQKESSYFECDQCRYRYNIVRARWAGFVLHPYLSITVAAVALMVATLVCGHLLSSVPHLDSAQMVWRFVSFDALLHFSHKNCGTAECEAACNTYNLWNWQQACYNMGCRCTIQPSDLLVHVVSALTNGLVVVGVLGLYLNRHILLHSYMNMVTLAACFFSASSAYGRLLLVLGVLHSFHMLLGVVRLRTKAIMTRWGETILSVRQ